MSIDNLLQIMSQLRHPEDGCPWDVEQSFESIAPYTIEEAYEVQEAITNGDYENLKEELGDLLLQVVFHSQIAKEAKLFAFDQVVDSICKKMIDRHPHVFGDAKIKNAEEQLSSWEYLKAKERQKSLKTSSIEESALDGVSLAYPALLRAQKLQKRAARVGFDWEDVGTVLEKLDEEVIELKEVLTNTDASGSKRVEEELGDILFTCVNIARHIKIDPETALYKANRKFSKRFKIVEKLLKEELNLKPEQAEFSDLEDRWERAKIIDC